MRCAAQGWKRFGAAKGVARFAEGGFDTPSGKVEFFSSAALALGLDALPDYIAPLEDTRSELARRFPLAMISPPARHFLNSSFVNVASLRAVRGRAVARYSSGRRRARRGIVDGSYVSVFNDRGSLRLRARVSDRARRGVVVALSVWWKKLTRDGKNANELTQRRYPHRSWAGRRCSTTAWSRSKLHNGFVPCTSRTRWVRGK